MTDEIQWWNDRARLDLIKQTICPAGIPDEDFAVAMEKCRRLDMDPLSGEVFVIKRNVNIARKGQPDNWVSKYEVQVAEAGMARRAESFPDYRGLVGAVIYQGDDILVDNATQTVMKHVTNPLKRGDVVGAWAVAKRQGMEFPVELLWLSEMKQETGQWGGKPSMMIWKCARAAALRRAFPETFAGTYAREEMLTAKERDEVPVPKAFSAAVSRQAALPAEAATPSQGALESPPAAVAEAGTSTPTPEHPFEEGGTPETGKTPPTATAGTELEDLRHLIAAGDKEKAKDLVSAVYKRNKKLGSQMAAELRKA